MIVFSASLFLVSSSTTFVRANPSSIFKDSISAFSGEKFGRTGFCLGFFPFVAEGGKDCGWKVRAAGSRIKAASWLILGCEAGPGVAREVWEEPEVQLRVVKVELAWVVIEAELVGLDSDGSEVAMKVREDQGERELEED